MTPARKSKVFTWWFTRVAQRRLCHAFGAIHVRGTDAVAAAAELHPLLFVSNHTAWWDPLLILVLTTRVLRLDPFAMMDNGNLQRLPFFGRVGAFGVTRDDPADGARAVRYAAKLLRGPKRAVWIFPQGRELPITTRPLRFRVGGAEIARIARKALVVPVAIRYAQASEPKPWILVSFGAPLVPDRDVSSGLVQQEGAVLRELDRIEEALLQEDLSDFRVIHRGAPSRLGNLAERALAALTR